MTEGAAGALVWEPDTGVTQVSEGVGQVKVRDLTGAGDNFAGAMIGALIGGASLARAAAAGNEAGSRSVEQLGAVGAIDTAAAGAGWPLGATVSQAVAASGATGPARASGTAAMKGLVDNL